MRPTFQWARQATIRRKSEIYECQRVKNVKEKSKTEDGENVLGWGGE